MQFKNPNVRNIANRFFILVCIEKFERVAFPFMSKKWQMWKINQSFKYFKQEFTHAVYVQKFDSIIVWTGIAFNTRKLFINSPNMTNSNTLIIRQRLPMFYKSNIWKNDKIFISSPNMTDVCCTGLITCPRQTWLIFFSLISPQVFFTLFLP